MPIIENSSAQAGINKLSVLCKHKQNTEFRVVKLGGVSTTITSYLDRKYERHNELNHVK